MDRAPRPDRADEVAAALQAMVPGLVRLVLARQERRRLGASAAERLSLPQHLTLLVLGDGGLPVTEVAARTGVAVSTATRMLQGLEREGLVSRGPAPGGDRRTRRAALTGEGREVLDRANALQVQRLRTLVDPLPPDSRRALLEGVQVFCEALGRVERAAAPGRVPG